MEYFVRVQYNENGSRILLPFGLEDGSVMAVRSMTTGRTAIALVYPAQWDRFMEERLSGDKRYYFNFASRQFEVKDHCVLLDRQFSDYLDADFVRVANGNTIKIEPFTARKSLRARRRKVA